MLVQCSWSRYVPHRKKKGEHYYQLKYSLFPLIEFIINLNNFTQYNINICSKMFQISFTVSGLNNFCLEVSLNLKFTFTRGMSLSFRMSLSVGPFRYRYVPGLIWWLQLNLLCWILGTEILLYRLRKLVSTISCDFLRQEFSMEMFKFSFRVVVSFSDKCCSFCSTHGLAPLLSYWTSWWLIEFIVIWIILKLKVAMILFFILNVHESIETTGEHKCFSIFKIS